MNTITNPKKSEQTDEQKIDSKYTVEYEDGVYTIVNEVTKEISILDAGNK